MTARDRLDRALLNLAADGRRPRCGEHTDLDLWTSDSVDDRRKAAELCAGCPILQPCALAAEEADECFHTWGGTDRHRARTNQKETR